MNTRRKTLPPVPAKAPAELRPLIAAMTEMLETGEGVRGNPLDRKLTMRDLLDGGVARLRIAGNPGSGLVLGDAPPDLSVPPAPTGFAASGSFFGMVHLSWDPPHERYRNHAYANIYRSETDNFANAALVGREAGMFYSDRVRNDITSVGDPLNLPGYYYWVTFSSAANIEGPPNSPDGAFARPLPDASYLLAQLSGTLGASQLDKTLRDRIDKIDGPATLAGSVAQLVSAENAARAAALANQNAVLSASIAAERDARIAGLASAQGYTDAKITAEQTARADGFSALATQIEQIEAGLGGDYTVGMAIERQARIDGDGALASSLASLTSYAQGVAADVVSEQQARVSADEALASDVSALYVEAGELQSSIYGESQARISGDSALSAVQQVIAAANAVGSAAHKVSSQVFINENEAMATRIEELRVEIGDTEAAIRTDMAVLATTDSALASSLATVQTTVAGNTASIQQHAESINGLSGAYTLKLDVNGYVSGFGAYNSGSVADFAVLADRFWIARPGAANSKVKPFMVLDGKVYMDSAFIRDASIEQGKLGPITFGKIFDSSGNPVTTVAGKLRADMLDVNSLKVGDANISGVIQSSAVNSYGLRRWVLDKNGGLTLNGAGAGGRMEIRDTVIKVFDSSGRLRVQIGDLNA